MVLTGYGRSLVRKTQLAERWPKSDGRDLPARPLEEIADPENVTRLSGGSRQEAIRNGPSFLRTWSDLVSRLLAGGNF